ncbi:MAG: hypothetical protein KBC27_00410 [Rickettsiales bacterium]|nr:hypothetical protein [Rickettsiales bacterium]
MAQNKYEILDMINDGDIKLALSSIQANDIKFTEDELASHIDNMISDNEEGEIEVDDRVALLKHLNEKGFVGAKKDNIERHLRIIDLYSSIEKDQESLIVNIKSQDSFVETTKMFQNTKTKVFSLADFDGKSVLSKPQSLFNSFFQSNLDVDISGLLKVFNFDTDNMNLVVTEFLSGDNDIQKIEGADCANKQICSRRKEKVLKSIVSVYGDKVGALEGDYADYLLVELMQTLFLNDDLSSSDIDLSRKLFRPDFFKDINKNHRALAKLIAKNMQIKYEIRALWHRDAKEASADLLEKIKAIHDAMDAVEDTIHKSDSSFKKSDASQLSASTSFGPKVSGIATRASDVAEAVESGNVLTLINLVSEPNTKVIANVIKALENCDSFDCYKEALVKFKFSIFGIKEDCDSQCHKDKKSNELTQDGHHRNNKDFVYDGFVNMYSFLSKQSSGNLSPQCSVFKSSSGDMQFLMSEQTGTAYKIAKVQNSCEGREDVEVITFSKSELLSVNPDDLNEGNMHSAFRSAVDGWAMSLSGQDFVEFNVL